MIIMFLKAGHDTLTVFLKIVHTMSKYFIVMTKRFRTFLFVPSMESQRFLHSTSTNNLGLCDFLHRQI